MKLYKYYFIVSIFIVSNISYSQSSNLGGVNEDILLNTIIPTDVTFSRSLTQKTPKAAFLSSSWGMRFNLNGGIRLDNTSNYDWVAGAQEIVDNLPNVGHVITNFTHPAHGYYYTLRDNPYVDVANDIHPAMVPSIENEQIILDVITIFKNSGKKVILYLNGGGPGHLQGNSAEELEIKAAWEDFYNATPYNGDEALAWRTLVKGYVERFKGLADGYWIDNLSNLPGEVSDFVAMIRAIDPDVAIATNLTKSYLKDENNDNILVDSDGTNDEDPTDYKVFFLEANDPYMDFTAGHPTPLGQGAPPNSWAYEEFNFPLITDNPWSSYDGSKQTLKHYFIPIRERWSVASADLVFEVEQAYRFVRTFTEAQATMTWSTTITDGFISDDEMSIMQEINDRMVQSPKPDFVPYVRPEGAFLVGEFPNYTFPTSVNGSEILVVSDEADVDYQSAVMNPNTTDPVATPHTATTVSSILPGTKNSKIILGFPTPVFPGANFSFSMKVYSDNPGTNGTGSGRIAIRLYNSTLGFAGDDRLEIVATDKIGGEWQTVSFSTDSLSETTNATITCAGGYDRMLILASNGATTVERLYFDDLEGMLENPGDGEVAISDTPTLATGNSWIYDNATGNLNYTASSFGDGSVIEETATAPASGLSNNASTTVLKVTRSITASSSGVSFKGDDFNYFHAKNIKFRVFPECDDDSDPTLEVRFRKSGENSGDTQLNSGTITMIPNQWNEITVDMSDKTPSLAPAVDNLYDTVLLFFNRTDLAETGGNFYYVDALQIKTGATNTWGGSVDSNWATDGNWSLGTVPTSTENVIIPTGLTTYPTITTAVSVNNVSIVDDASLVFSGAGNLTTTRNVTYNRTIDASKWYLMASPVVGETYDDVWVTDNDIVSGTNSNRGVSVYDNTSSDAQTGYWRYFQSGGGATAFNVGKGYGIIRATTGIVSFTGSGVYSDSQTTSIAQSASNYNLVSNPFTAYLNLGGFFANNALLTNNTIWVWDAANGAYDTKLSGTHNTYEIAHGQAFFVEAGTAGGTLNFDIADISHQGTDTFQKTSNTKTSIKISIADENNNKRNADIYFVEDATKGFDTGYDGELFGGTSHYFALFSSLLEGNGKKYQIQSLPTTLMHSAIIPLGLIADAGKSIALNATVENFPLGNFVYLEDRNKGSFTLLNDNDSFNFTSEEALYGIGRFYIHITSKALSTENEILESVSVYKLNNSTLRIIGLSEGNVSVKLFNVLGKQSIHISFDSNGVKDDINLAKLAVGIYVVQIETTSGKLNKKIILE